MLHFHATQKVLKAFGIEPVMYVSERAKDQRLHDWYVTYTEERLSKDGLLLFIHAPTLMTIVVKEKKIEPAITKFRKQLPRLLKRFKLLPAFVQVEMSHANEHIIGKAIDRSMIGKVAQLAQFVRHYSRRFEDSRSINVQEIEDLLMTGFHLQIRGHGYMSTYEYWKMELFRVKARMDK